jgi:hypothetical protein
VHHYQKTVNVHAVLMKAHPRQHWKALGQARNLDKRCTRPLGQRPESQYKSYSRPYETNPQTEPNMYVSKGMCTSSLGQTLRPGQTYIYIIYIRDRPTQPEAIRRCPELGEVVSLEPKCVYIYIYYNIWMHVNIYIYRYEYVNILKSLCVREEVPVCCDAVL